ncbi:tartronate semialdehyde reductase [miscellaneous Crenarchaeota group archaeon SMTZ1-55]|nr:MAG: tartronate semialdehyde reductase [miscellaneous Crenarchaeota group archaeon SMTZ1-55]
MKIGFIGLGVMGNPMAKNLLKAGHHLIVYDIIKAKVEDLVQAGAEAAQNCRDAASRGDVIILMLPDSPEVEAVMRGEEGVLAGARPGALIIDMSSISPLVDIALEKKAREQNLRMIDAPVSGGEPGAIAGTLAIMVGGDEAAFAEAQEILHVMGKSVVRVGAIGAGQFTKLANQILVGVHLQAMSEALVFAQKAGLDVQKVYEAVRGGLAGSHVLDAKTPLVLKRNFAPGFRIRLHIKDLKNALIAGRELGIPLPATALAQAFFEACDAAGRGDLDHGALITVTEELAKVRVGEEA